MNKIIKGIVIATVAVLAIIGGGVAIHNWVVHPSTNMLAGDASTSFPSGITVGGGAYAVTPALAITGSQTISSNLTISGTNTVNTMVTTVSNGSLTAATNTPMDIVSPAATSTLEKLVINITTASTTNATTLATVATSTLPNATTTGLTTGTFGVVSARTMTYTWYPVLGTGIVPPSTHLVLGIQGGTSINNMVYTYGGTYTAVWNTGY